MSLFSFFQKTLAPSNAALPEIFPLSLVADDFIKTDLLSTYSKILTDTVERIHGLNPDQEKLLWDNCVQNENSIGLVTMLANAMVEKQELFIVYKPSVEVLRVATFEEKEQIRKDYKKQGESPLGVFISFRNYRRTDMLKIYATLEFCILASLHKTVNISKAVQLKMHDLRGSVSLSDSSIAIEQAKAIAEALRCGNDILLDKNDEVTTATPNIEPTEKAIGFLDAKRAFLLALPISYISGLQTPGIGSTGEADMRAVERGLKQYFVSILQPAITSIFKVETEFKSQDFRQITNALEALKTFDLVSDEVLSNKTKREILARLFDVNADDEAKALEAEAKEREANPPKPKRNAFGNDEDEDDESEE